VRRRRYGGAATALATVWLAAAGCTAARPERPQDLCSVFAERPEWYEAARDAYRHWGVPVPLQLAVIHHESGFRADARPPRSTFLWIFPGPRPSSAYGYGQVLDDTWENYVDTTGRWGADRDDFEDVVDFIGWYGYVGARRYGISRTDPYSFYLAYYEGHGGFARGTHRRNAAVRNTARRVAALAKRYDLQYQGCRGTLDDAVDSPWWWPF